MMQDDEIIGKAYDSRLMKRLLEYLKPYKWFVIMAILLSIFVASFGPLRPYLTKVIIDDYIVKKDYNGMIFLIIILFFTIIIQGALQYGLNFITQWIGQKTIFNLRMQVFKHLQKLSLKFYDKNPIGRLVTRVTSDVEVLNEMFSSGVVMVFSDIFTIICILSFMFFIDAKLALVSLSVLPFLIYGTFLFRRKVRDMYREIRKLIASMNSFMNEHFSGMNTVQIFSRQKKSFDEFDRINDDHKNAQIRSVFYYAVYYPSVDFLTSTVVALIIWYGGSGVLSGYMTVGILISFIQYTEMFFRPIRDLAEKYNILQTAMASSERVFKLLDDKTIQLENEKDTQIEKIKGEIEFKNVWFAYNNEEYVLKNISFKINPGEIVAFVGATGAGKTSIISLLSRFYEVNKGQIFLDGMDITKMKTEQLRKNIGIVLQDVFIFSGDIKQNISLGDEKISQDEVASAARTVGIDNFIESLPDKYNAEVKERGATLSVGQKQLLSFARAVAYNPGILVLDEATSSVDTESEILIQKAIKELLKGRTSIVIAHRLSTIQNADKIIVLHHGEIRETGNHQELLEKKGLYYRLYQLQYKKTLDKSDTH
jgi:ATP-binding cassette, subfamily B, multidrug efflux pump